MINTKTNEQTSNEDDITEKPLDIGQQDMLAGKYLFAFFGKSNSFPSIAETIMSRELFRGLSVKACETLVITELDSPNRFTPMSQKNLPRQLMNFMSFFLQGFDKTPKQLKAGKRKLLEDMPESEGKFEYQPGGRGIHRDRDLDDDQPVPKKRFGDEYKAKV